MDFQLSSEQTAAVSHCMDPGHNFVILTGQAGSGKSTIIKSLKGMGGVTVAATTGKAAMNIDGITVDKLFGIDRQSWRLFNPSYTDFSMRKCEKTILIDEASMVGQGMANLLYDAAKSYNKRLILVGDWGQASPVKDNWPFDSPMFLKSKFVKLNECHRQSDSAFLGALNKVRLGQVDSSVTEVFNRRASSETPDRNYEGICMFGTNKTADSYNEQCLRDHVHHTKCRVVYPEPRIVDMRSQKSRDSKPLTMSDTDKMFNDSPFNNNKPLAIGAKVVCTKNDSVGNTYQNGTMGIIKDIILSDGRVVSKLHASEPAANISAVILETFSGDTIRIGQDSINVRGAGGDIHYRIDGIPVILGYAVTVHKAQGMTVDSAWASINSIGYFKPGTRHGLAYVALSRVRTLQGLILDAWRNDVIECDATTNKWL